jgi:hypothetical protein
MKISSILSTLALTAALMTPALVTPTVMQARPNGVAMFDDQHRDFTPDDEKAWHDYLKEKRKKDHEWAKASKREQTDYWKWRDAHPDHH